MFASRPIGVARSGIVLSAPRSIWRLQWLKLLVLAEHMSKEDHILMRQANVRSVAEEHSSAAHQLNQRWIELCRAVQECSATDVGVATEIEDLAKVCR